MGSVNIWLWWFLLLYRTAQPTRQLQEGHRQVKLRIQRLTIEHWGIILSTSVYIQTLGFPSISSLDIPRSSAFAMIRSNTPVLSTCHIFSFMLFYLPTLS